MWSLSFHRVTSVTPKKGYDPQKLVPLPCIRHLGHSRLGLGDLECAVGLQEFRLRSNVVLRARSTRLLPSLAERCPEVRRTMETMEVPSLKS